MRQLLFGCAYYDEYMPCERLQEDMKMMKDAGINTIRIAESTWSTYEPVPGVFDFSHVLRVLDAAETHGLQVIVGTPTYAIPAWMAKRHPDVLVDTVSGRKFYGKRQIMDITHPVFRFYAERIIRKLMEITANRLCVVGFQLDNETKYYNNVSANVQDAFIKHLRETFHDDLDAMNRAFGLDYWSNRIGAWEDFPDVRATINGSLASEFDKFRRTLVDEYLAWQASIVNEYRRKDQFITQNFDLEWRGYSFGIQPQVNHLHAARCLSIASVDIYHPSQDKLTGAEIAFGGDLTRSLKKDNYYVMETAAQGYPGWLPYRGQLRLQAYSHLASGADSVLYWHWHTIHNSYETYWKGILSQDFEKNEIYEEAGRIGHEWQKIGSRLLHLKKQNRAAVLVSNEAYSALDHFRIDAVSGNPGKAGYNDVLRWMYDALYRMNIECDIIWPETEDLSQYDLVIVPALYSASEETIRRLRDYVALGGTLVASFKTGFCNEFVKVWPDRQPHGLTDVFGISYSTFTFPENTGLSSSLLPAQGERASLFMECLNADRAEVLAGYDHPNWGRYAAVTRNRFGRGTAYYIGCMTSEAFLQAVYRLAIDGTGIKPCTVEWPLAVRRGTNRYGKKVTYLLNYSWDNRNYVPTHDAVSLLDGKQITAGDTVAVGPWDVVILERK